MRDYSWADSQELVVVLADCRMESGICHYPHFKDCEGNVRVLRGERDMQVSAITVSGAEWAGCFGVFCKGKTLGLYSRNTFPKYDMDGRTLIPDINTNSLVTEQRFYHPEKNRYYHILNNVKVTGIWFDRDYYYHLVYHGTDFEHKLLQRVVSAYRDHVVLI